MQAQQHQQEQSRHQCGSSTNGCTSTQNMPTSIMVPSPIRTNEHNSAHRRYCYLISPRLDESRTWLITCSPFMFTEEHRFRRSFDVKILSKASSAQQHFISFDQFATTLLSLTIRRRSIRHRSTTPLRASYLGLLRK